MAAQKDALRLEVLPLDDVHPYQRNPRNNRKAVKAVAESIRQCGYCAPIVVDENHIILAGHTRYAALRLMKWGKAQVIIKTGLTEEQKRKYRILDNKTGELAEWDAGLLDIEMAGLDFSNFDFGLEESTLEEYTPVEFKEPVVSDLGKGARVDSWRSINFDIFDETKTAGPYGIPTLEPCDYIPESLIRFDLLQQQKTPQDTVHFFIFDVRFEQVWRRPDLYADIIKRKAKAMISPDFSIYTDMPKAMQIWNLFRCRLIGQYFHSKGIPVIPQLQWAQESTFEWCFDGFPKHSVVAVSSKGVTKDAEARRLWIAGMQRAIEVTEPTTILCYGKPLPDCDYHGIPVKEYKLYDFR